MAGKRIQERSKRATAYPIPVYTQIEVRDYDNGLGAHRTRGMVTGSVNSENHGPFIIMYDNGRIEIANYDTFVEKFEEIPDASDNW